MTILISDSETNGYKPSQIWCLGIQDFASEDFTLYHGYDDSPTGLPAGIARLLAADLTVWHGGLRYDLPIFERLCGVAFDRSKVYDTLVSSKLFHPGRKHHSLASWGETFGFPKGTHADFSCFSPEMARYCERDVRITAKLFGYLESKITG